MSTNLTYGIILIILAILIYGLSQRKSSPNLTAIIPSTLTSIGILGTFIGVFIGLLEFKVSDLENSIPILLEGLKTAFATSIAGMTSAIFFKSYHAFQESKIKDIEAGTSDDPVELLKNISSGIRNLDESSNEVKETIVSCLRSDEEFSLLSQFKLIRQEMSDGRKEILKAFNDFAETMADSNTSALVEALEKVMGDFNALLNELVSESFKELAEAMVNLNKWQENYKEHVEDTQNNVAEIITTMKQLSNRIEVASQHFERIDINLDSIDGSLSTITVSSEDIARHIEHLKQQNEYLSDLITSVKHIGDEAKSVIPSFNENINELTSKLEQTVITVSEKLDNAGSEITSFVQESNKKINESMDSYEQTINDSMKKIDEGLEQELTKALDSIAASLGSLSQKFAEDYSPITERLREIIRVAERANA